MSWSSPWSHEHSTRPPVTCSSVPGRDWKPKWKRRHVYFGDCSLLVLRFHLKPGPLSSCWWGPYYHDANPTWRKAIMRHVIIDSRSGNIFQSTLAFILHLFHLQLTYSSHGRSCVSRNSFSLLKKKQRIFVLHFNNARLLTASKNHHDILHFCNNSWLNVISLAGVLAQLGVRSRFQ